MDVGVVPLRQHIDVPLQGIVHHHLGNRTVPRKAAVSAIRLRQPDNKGGEVIELAGYGLARRQRHGDRGRRDLRQRGALATRLVRSARHNQVLQRLGIVLRADAGEVAGNRMARHAMFAEVCLAGLGVPHKNIKLARSTPVGKRLAVQKSRDGANVPITQIKPGHPLVGKAVSDDGSDKLAFLIIQDNFRADQIRSRFSASGVCAMAKAAVGFKQLLSLCNFRRRRRWMRRVGWRTMKATASGSRRGLRGSFGCRLLGKCEYSHCKNEDKNSEIM